VQAGGICLDDQFASRCHARIEWDGTDREFVLDDEGSVNGTFVNGQAVASHVLSDQDVIRIGDSFLIYDRKPKTDCVRSRAMRLAPSSMHILLTGETGTGKEVLARLIHDASGRTGPLVPVNCGALPREIAAAELFGHTRGAFSGAGHSRAGLFATAVAGTLFLDEIGDLSLDLQPALLRVLEDQTVRPVGSDREVTVDTRIVAATNVDLPAAIAGGRFRADLYARLAQGVLELPPLRRRRSQIPELVTRWFASADRPAAITPDALEVLLLRPYPFNIRELKSLVTEFLNVTTSDAALDLDYLKVERPERAARAEKPIEHGQDPLERDRLVQLLDLHRGNVSAVAKQLGKPRAQIYRWLNRFGLSPHQHRGSTDSE
jgi:DNA-binding NtrC family response regulator